MQVFDTHVHFWDLSLNKHNWLTTQIEDTFIGDYEAIRKNYLPNDYKHDTKDYHLVGLTHVQAGWDIKDPGGETQWIDCLLNKEIFLNSVVGYADLTSNRLDSFLEEHIKYSNVSGIRQILNWHSNPQFSMCARNLIEDESFEKGFARLKNYKLHFEVQAYSYQLEKLLSLFKQHEDIPIVIQHCGMPLFLSLEDMMHWKSTLKKAAELQHVCFKISGLGMFQHLPKQFLTRKEIISYAINVFGVDRCVFGSNFPVDKLAYSYAETLKPILECGLSALEQEKVLWKNAVRVYKKNEN